MKKRTYKTTDGAVTVKADRRDAHLTAELIADGADPITLEGEFAATGPNAGFWTVSGGKRHAVAAAREKNGTVWAAIDGRVYRFESISDDGEGAAAVAENMIAAPMPGKVTKVFVAAGDEVEEGAPVLIVEAMKMEHTLRAPMAGTVTSLACAEGEQVEANVPLAEIE